MKCLLLKGLQAGNEHDVRWLQTSTGHQSKLSFVLFSIQSDSPFTIQIGLQHVFEVRELEELTEEWLAGKLVRG